MQPLEEHVATACGFSHVRLTHNPTDRETELKSIDEERISSEADRGEKRRSKQSREAQQPTEQPEPQPKLRSKPPRQEHRSNSLAQAFGKANSQNSRALMGAAQPDVARNQPALRNSLKVADPPAHGQPRPNRGNHAHNTGQRFPALTSRPRSTSRPMQLQPRSHSTPTRFHNTRIRHNNAASAPRQKSRGERKSVEWQRFGRS